MIPPVDLSHFIAKTVVPSSSFLILQSVAGTPNLLPSVFQACGMPLFCGWLKSSLQELLEESPDAVSAAEAAANIQTAQNTAQKLFSL